MFFKDKISFIGLSQGGEGTTGENNFVLFLTHGFYQLQKKTFSTDVESSKSNQILIYFSVTLQMHIQWIQLI